MDLSYAESSPSAAAEGYFAKPAAVLTSVDIVIPVLNEERALTGCVETLHTFLNSSFPLPWRITIVDNGSTDATWLVATTLANTLDRVVARRLEIRGRGAALKVAWRESPADIVAYMDVDLSTDLGALLPLIAPLASGHSEIAIGTRLAPGSRTRRGLKRELVSRCYNLLLRLGFGARFTDAQCGFKAIRKEYAIPLLDKVADDRWFFDTELLLFAEYNGLRVHEVPVDWIEDMDSRVNVWRTAIDDLKGMARVNHAISSGRAAVAVSPRAQPAPAHPEMTLRRSRATTLTKIAKFAVIGAASTLVHAGLYALSRSAWSPVWANLGALVITALTNTEANRRWTFNRAGGKRTRVHSRAGMLFAVNYVVTSGAVVTLTTLAPDAGRGLEVAVLVAAYGLMTVLRFIALDRWVFARPARVRATGESGAPAEPGGSVEAGEARGR
jgi:glycosyltransferase involved in cell wall biosynthesis